MEPNFENRNPKVSNRDKANKVKLTEETVRNLECPALGNQTVVWDEKEGGLSVLLSGTTKTRTYRATYIISHEKDHPDAGKPITKTTQSS